MTDSSPSNLVASLRELSQAFVDGRQDRYGMRVPAEPDRDGDLVCSRAAAEIERLQRELEQHYQENGVVAKSRFESVCAERDGANRTIANFMGPEGDKYIDRFAALIAGPVSLEESARKYPSPEPGANSCADPEPCVSHMALESLQAQLRELSQAMSNPALEWGEDSSIEAALIAEATRRLAQPPKTRRDTGVTDEAGLPILEGDRVNVTWLAELGITELDCEAVGTVEYMPDRITAAWFVKFDSPFRRHVGPEGIYESDSMMLIQTTGDEFTCAFEKLPATPPANAGDAP